MTFEITLGTWLIPTVVTFIVYILCYQEYRRSCPRGHQNQWDGLVWVALFGTGTLAVLINWVVYLSIRLYWS